MNDKPTEHATTDLSIIIEQKLNEAYDMAVEHCIEILKAHQTHNGELNFVIDKITKLKKYTNAKQ